MKSVLVLLPILAFAILGVFLFKGLYLDPQELPSALVNKQFPTFELPSIDEDKVYTESDIRGPVLVNIWATWCSACYSEHPVLNRLSDQGVKIIGINYKDNKDDASRWLKTLHNPYYFNIYDKAGTLGFDLGVYGAPETFFIDSSGIIQYRFVGVIDDFIWQQELNNIYKSLE